MHPGGKVGTDCTASCFYWYLPVLDITSWITTGIKIMKTFWTILSHKILIFIFSWKKVYKKDLYGFITVMCPKSQTNWCVQKSFFKNEMYAFILQKCNCFTGFSHIGQCLFVLINLCTSTFDGPGLNYLACSIFVNY